MERVGVRWIVIAIAAGIVAGRVALLGGYGITVMIGVLLFAGFAAVAFLRPLVAVQVMVFMIVTGIATQAVGTFVGTAISIGDVLLAVLFGVWLISGRGLRAIRTRRFGPWVFAVVGMWLVFSMLGIARGHPWPFLQLDTIPGLYLLAFFPIVDVLRDEGAVRSVVRAGGLGLVVMSLGLVYEFVVHYDAPEGNFLTTWGKVYPTEGPAGGPKVIPFAGQWISAGLLGGLLWMQRREPGRTAMGPFLFAGLMGIALLLVYTRSLMALTVFSVALLGLALARQPRRAFSMAGATAAVVAILAVSIPLLGGSVGGVVEGLRGRFTNLGQDPSWEFRRTESRAGIEVFADHPFVGEGFGVIVSIPELEAEGRPPSNAFQNAYVGLLAKTGIVGTSVFVAFLLSLIVRGVRRGLSGPGRMRLVLVAGGVWLVGMALASYSSDYLQIVSGMFYLALFAALVAAFEGFDEEAAAAAEAEAQARPHAEDSTPERVLSRSRSG